MSHTPIQRMRSAWLASLMALACGSAVCASNDFDPLQKPSAASVRAQTGVLLNLAKAGDRLVAVGERGLVLLSDDAGAHWRQVEVPVSVTLTGVSFVDAQQGWAVGHGQVVLHTEDGGQTWRKQLDGVQAAQIELAAAKAATSGQDAALKMAERLVAQGADKPWLDVHFDDRLNGLVIGAYGAIFQTRDGGKSWQSRRADVPNPAGKHLYRLQAQGSSLYIAGEQGALFFASQRDGTFEAVNTSYVGTFFGVVPTAEGDLVAYGLRGNIWRRAAGSTQWTKVDTPAPVTITAGARLADGSLVFTDESGKLLRSTDRGAHVTPVAIKQAAPLTGIVQHRDGSLVLTTARGPLKVPATALTGSTQP